MRLAHALRWHGEDFKWGTALFYVYNSPSETAGRWNEVGNRLIIGGLLLTPFTLPPGVRQRGISCTPRSPEPRRAMQCVQHPPPSRRVCAMPQVSCAVNGARRPLPFDPRRCGLWPPPQVLIPARPMHQLLLGEGEDLFAGETDGGTQELGVNNEEQAVVAQ